MSEFEFDVVVIGGGPAGMAAALESSKNGAKTLILERDVKLGGILNQCIHQGFGLHYFGEEMTGPEYAFRFRKMIENSSVQVMLESMVLSIDDNAKIVTFISPKYGYSIVKTKSIVLAMGCRERSAGAIMLPGSRPAGIYTAGMAQKICNLDGYLVGKNVVILGSGDIGLIMARRMTIEGANVKLVLELMPFSSGLKRNLVQCLDDYNIPIKYSHTITKVVGSPRLTGLFYAPVDKDGKPILEKQEFIECDTLLLSVGLIPENDLLVSTGVDISNVTSGAIVDQNRMTSVKGIFSCGNVLHVHDLVDNVSKEAEIAGRSASNFALNKIDNDFKFVKVIPKDGIRYVLPQIIRLPDNKIKIFYRVKNVFKKTKIIVETNNVVVYSKKYSVLAPGTMGSELIDVSNVSDDIIVRLE